MIAALVSSAVLLRNEMPAGHIPLASAPLLRGLHRFLGTVWESLVFQFGERANYEAHFGSVGSRYLLHFYNVLYRVCPGAQQLSQTDKNRALQLLESTRKDVLDATKGLSDAQWNFKIVPDRWSAAECIEHIAAAEDYIPGDDHRESDGRSGRPQPRRR